jgi:hypothetical protein
VQRQLAPAKRGIGEELDRAILNKTAKFDR